MSIQIISLGNYLEDAGSKLLILTKFGGCSLQIFPFVAFGNES